MSTNQPYEKDQAGSLNARLRAARDRQGLSLADIAELTNVRKEYLSALENGRYNDLPEDVYTRNFLKLFALAVGEKPDLLLQLFSEERAKAQAPNQVDNLDKEPDPENSLEQRQFKLSPVLPYLLLIAAVILLMLWGFNASLFQSNKGSQTPNQLGKLMDDTRQSPDAGDGLSEQLKETTISLFSIVTDPPGAEVSIDSFTLANVTPIENTPITALPSRQLVVSLDGYEVYKQQVDLSSDRRLEIALTPESSSATPNGYNDDLLPETTIVISVTATTWLEVFQGDRRNEGQRLVYSTVEPPEQFEFSLPVYIHAGNAIGVHLNIGDKDLGPLGDPGEVLGRSFTR